MALAIQVTSWWETRLRRAVTSPPPRTATGNPARLAGILGSLARDLGPLVEDLQGLQSEGLAALFLVVLLSPVLLLITLGTLMLTDLYIMLLASGTISDLRFFN